MSQCYEVEIRVKPEDKAESHFTEKVCKVLGKLGGDVFPIDVFDGVHSFRMIAYLNLARSEIDVHNEIVTLLKKEFRSSIKIRTGYICLDYLNQEWFGDELEEDD